jgi:DNA-binding transcriptional LysR family regulator
MANWDDLRYVLALSRHGSLARTAKALDVDHTTVGRRVESAETALGVTLFARTSQGYVPTLEGERVLFDLLRVEDAVLALQRGADASKSVVEGAVRVTSPETLGATYLAPLLAGLGARYPRLALELVTTGTVLDLSRREADVAVRFFRTPHEALVVRRVGHVAYGLYASHTDLRHVPMPDEPSEPIWLTVHKDVKGTPRVRAVLDTLGEAFVRDAERLAGTARERSREAMSRGIRARTRP